VPGQYPAVEIKNFLTRYGVYIGNIGFVLGGFEGTPGRVEDLVGVGKLLVQPEV